MKQIWDQINTVLGLHEQAQDLKFYQISLRAIIMFISILVMLRVSHKRFLAKRNTLDTLLGFLLASMLARTINGSEPFFASIGTGFVVVFVHRFFAWACSRFPSFELLIKSKPSILVESGILDRDELREHDISEDDLKEDLRLTGGTDDLRKVKKAQLERNGEISVEEQQK
ncbi:MAG: hypothetical protein JWM04_435 [Verrucomicrobiales bacterium]|nr:hypothetical protein [Verrucomicrobiales bacterium]